MNELLVAFGKVAPFLTEPLVLIGFALLLFMGLLHALLKSKPMEQVRSGDAGKALLKGLRYGFILAIVVAVLGFAFAAYRIQRSTVNADRLID